MAPSAPPLDEAIRAGFERARRRRGRIPGHRMHQAIKDCGKPRRALLTRTFRTAMAAAIADPTFSTAELLAVPHEIELHIRVHRGEQVPPFAVAMREEQAAQCALDEMQWCVDGPHTIGDLHELEARAFEMRAAVDRLIVATRRRMLEVTPPRAA